jgi:hypothetical protein
MSTNLLRKIVQKALPLLQLILPIILPMAHKTVLLAPVSTSPLRHLSSAERRFYETVENQRNQRWEKLIIKDSRIERLIYALFTEYRNIDEIQQILLLVKGVILSECQIRQIIGEEAMKQNEKDKIKKLWYMAIKEKADEEVFVLLEENPITNPTSRVLQRRQNLHKQNSQENIPS